MILLLVTYLYKRFEHRLNFNAANLQKGKLPLVLQPVQVQSNRRQPFSNHGI